MREMLERRRKDAPDAQLVYGDGNGQSFVWSLDRQHAELSVHLKERLGLQDPAEFVV